MTWIITGLILLSSLYPFQRAVHYFHTSYESAQGWTRRERHGHYSRSLLTLAQLVFAIGFGMIVWGLMESIPEKYVDMYLDTKVKDVTEMESYGHQPGGLYK